MDRIKKPFGVCFRESLIIRLHSEIDQIHLSIEAQCDTTRLPLGDCHILILRTFPKSGGFGFHLNVDSYVYSMGCEVKYLLKECTNLKTVNIQIKSKSKPIKFGKNLQIRIWICTPLL